MYWINCYWQTWAETLSILSVTASRDLGGGVGKGVGSRFYFIYIWNKNATVLVIVNMESRAMNLLCEISGEKLREVRNINIYHFIDDATCAELPRMLNKSGEDTLEKNFISGCMWEIFQPTQSNYSIEIIQMYCDECFLYIWQTNRSRGHIGEKPLKCIRFQSIRQLEIKWEDTHWKEPFLGWNIVLGDSQKWS